MTGHIVFIINSVSNQRCIKRVNEFVERGYRVTAYGFSRKIEMHNSINAKLEIIGEYSNSQSYPNRMEILWKGIKQVVKKHKRDNVLYYLFGLDIALVFNTVCRERYIYEESDLAHTYIGYSFIRKAFEFIDVCIIRRSLLTVFTSEGFLKYHFGVKKPNNCVLIENRLNKSILDLTIPTQKTIDNKSLSIGFVGGPRFDSVYNFIDVFCRNYPQHVFHIFGGPILPKFEDLKKYNNCIFHGYFKNPDDLPKIYAQLDLVLSTYDVKFENVRYAEPNKLYEAIYFDTPIIVTNNTFLAEKVERLGIGYSINPLDEESIKSFINSLTSYEINCKIDKIKSMDKKIAININDHFFNTLENKLKR